MKKEEEKKRIKPSFMILSKGRRTFGQKAADNLAAWAGSWKFIIGFTLFLLAWIYLNLSAWVNSWDPYPFILLNLTLSCLAAIQAPIILMSQNRQAQKDRNKFEYDYLVNKKSEKEIREIKRQLSRIEEYILKRKLK